MNSIFGASPSPLRARIAIYLHGVFRRIYQRDLLSGYRFVHVMNNGIHSAGVVEFITRNFANAEHAFVYPVTTHATRERLGGTQHVYEFPLDSLHPQDGYKVIVHGLFTDETVNYLHAHPNVLRAAYWFIWGGDLYNAKDSVGHTAVRKGFAGIITSFDRAIYIEKYGANRFYDVAYAHEMTQEMARAHVRAVGDPIHIQINNSADVTTLEMLEQLARFKDEKIRVTTILSYLSNGQPDCRLEIIRRGQQIFGDSFNPILQFMETSDYASHLATVDIYISNQNRQQGNANAAYICSKGGKVFVKSDTSVYCTYNKLGIRYFDTYQIPNMTFAQFIAREDAERVQTTELLQQRMSPNFKRAQWEAMFQMIHLGQPRASALAEDGSNCGSADLAPRA